MGGCPLRAKPPRKDPARFPEGSRKDLGRIPEGSPAVAIAHRAAGALARVAGVVWRRFRRPHGLESSSNRPRIVLESSLKVPRRIRPAFATGRTPPPPRRGRPLARRPPVVTASLALAGRNPRGERGGLGSVTSVRTSERPGTEGFPHHRGGWMRASSTPPGKTPPAAVVSWPRARLGRRAACLRAYVALAHVASTWREGSAAAQRFVASMRSFHWPAVMQHTA
jgi:hypothetical protein